METAICALGAIALLIVAAWEYRLKLYGAAARSFACACVFALFAALGLLLD